MVETINTMKFSVGESTATCTFPDLSYPVDIPLKTEVMFAVAVVATDVGLTKGLKPETVSVVDITVLETESGVAQ
jgi:hypothetical protein